jgi:DNA-binding transcriptional ArsR family regulator
MNESIRRSIADLASRFANQVLEVVGSAVYDAVAEARDGKLVPTRGRGGRRSSADVEQAKSRIVAALGRQPGGVRAEALRAELRFSRSEIGRPLKALLRSGAVKKSGERRLTLYRLGPAAAGENARSHALASKAKAATAKKSARTARKATTARSSAAAAAKKSGPGTRAPSGPKATPARSAATKVPEGLADTKG